MVERKGDAQGGSEDPSIYVKRKELNYCDKGGHLQRSIVNKQIEKERQGKV